MVFTGMLRLYILLYADDLDSFAVSRKGYQMTSAFWQRTVDSGN